MTDADKDAHGDDLLSKRESMPYKAPATTTTTTTTTITTIHKRALDSVL